MSLDKAERAALNISRVPHLLVFRRTPYQRSIRSSTNSYRKELMWSFGSLGPGIIPTTIRFSVLKRSSLGRFITTMSMTPIEFEPCLGGWNQSTFNMRPKLFGTARKGSPSTYWNSFHTLPSKQSPRTFSGNWVERLLHLSQFFYEI